MQAMALYTTEEMYRADALAEASGIDSIDLMENAGRAVAAAITERWQQCPVVILCGPGNNGGDGFVVARLLADAGWPVRLALLGDPADLKGDAKINAERWSGGIEALDMDILDGAELIIDALFGAGLARAIDGRVAGVVEAINDRGLDCVGIDVPSGIDGNTGAILGTAPWAALTVTFFRAKPGHVLMPGRARCGEIVVADIGIPDTVEDDIGPSAFVNGPELWQAWLPWPETDTHKYQRGHAVVAGGTVMTGAARLAALAARRIGAGLVTVAAPGPSFAIYAADPGTLVHPIDGPDDFADLLADKRKNAVLVGPGLGTDEGAGAGARALVLAALQTEAATVIDADGLTVFQDTPQALFKAIRAPCVLTPHEGEFRRLFDAAGDKPTRARAAARESGAVVVLKGPDTVIAAPDGTVSVNTSGTPYLATAGSGDILSGLILGLLAQGMDAFDAASAGVWLHGRAAEHFGPGLIAEDLPDIVPAVFDELFDITEGIT